MPNDKAAWRVGFYQDHRGQSPVLDFINGLPARDRARIDLAIRLLKEFGTELGMPHARLLRDRIWELGQEAFDCFILLISTINSSFCIVFAKLPIKLQNAKSKPQYDG